VGQENVSNPQTQQIRKTLALILRNHERLLRNK